MSFLYALLAYLICHLYFCFVIAIYAEQVSEEVERALAKLGPPRISGR